KPQVQERLTTEIAEAIERALSPRGVFVVIEAEHLCMTTRGVKKPGSLTVTSAVRGLFRTDARTRQEAMDHIRMRCDHSAERGRPGPRQPGGRAEILEGLRRLPQIVFGAGPRDPE